DLLRDVVRLYEPLWYSRSNIARALARSEPKERNRCSDRRYIYLRVSSASARSGDTVRYVDPVRNPYAPGAGQRPPELAGRDREREVFEVVLERVARARPERSVMLTALRGVGKTVLLNTLRSQAINRLWGTGKVEARPDQSLRRPLSAALHMAVREIA